jgi:HSP20 family protein
MKSFLPNLFSEAGGLQDFAALRRHFDDAARDFGRGWPSLLDVGAAGPAVNVAETATAIEISAELPGVDEKDIKVEIDGPRIVVSGEKKREREEKDKDWRLVERSYGAFRRSLALPFDPAHDAVSAHFDKGVLKIAVQKPVGATQTTKSVEIKTGPAPAAPQPTTTKAA